MSDWKELPLLEVYDVDSGLSKPRAEFGFGYGFVSFKDVMDNYFLPENLTKLVNSTDKERQKCSVKRGDVFLTRTSETQAELGLSCVALRDYPNATFNGFTKRLRPLSTGQVVPEYAAYYFRGPKFRRSVTAMSTLSTRASLNNSMISSLEIELPPYDVQQEIGKVLKSLDDKIELNRRMNATLEGMARAIFKSWFVDFDPVRARMDGRQPHGMDEATAALFPSEFEETELGKTPKGWKNATLNDVSAFKRRNIKPDELEENAAYIGLEHMPKRCVTLGEWGSTESVGSTKSKFERGEILFGKLRPYFHKVGIAPTNGVCSTDILTIVPQTPQWRSFSLFHYSSDELIGHANACSTGTKMPRVNWKDLARFDIVKPTVELVERFEKVAGPMLDRCIENIFESQTLAKLRDTLLPKLLSGEVRMPEAEAMVGRVV